MYQVSPCNLFQIHQNPCYYKQETVNTILKKGETIHLHHGDIFSFAIHSPWLKIEISYENPPTNGSKRKNSPELVSETPNKIVKKGLSQETARFESSTLQDNFALDTNIIIKKELDDTSLNVVTDSTVDMNIFNVVKTEPVTTTMSAEIPPINNKAEDLDTTLAVDFLLRRNNEAEKITTITSTGAPLKLNETDDSTAVTAENTASTSLVEPIQEANVNDDVTATASTGADCDQTSTENKQDSKKQQRVWRDRCWYGKSCYR